LIDCLKLLIILVFLNVYSTLAVDDEATEEVGGGGGGGGGGKNKEFQRFIIS
jgi:hypothetical protein